MTNLDKAGPEPTYHDLLKMYRELPGEHHGAPLQAQWRHLPATPEMVRQLTQFAAEHDAKFVGLTTAHRLLIDEMARELGTERKRSTAEEPDERDSEDREENDRILSGIHALDAAHPLLQAADVCLSEALHAKRVSQAMTADARQLAWVLQSRVP